MKKQKNLKSWWHKEISPFISLLLLLAAILIIFIAGTLFIKKYLETWSEISNQSNNFYLKIEKENNRPQLNDITIP